MSSRLDALTLALRKVESLLEIVTGRPVIRRKDLQQRYGVDEATIDRWKKDGVLPKPRYLRGCPFPFWTPFAIEANEHNNPTLTRAFARSVKRANQTKTTSPTARPQARQGNASASQ